MACTAAAAHRLQIVFARKQVQVPYLGLAGHEQLQGTGHQHLPVAFAQGAVVGAVHLVVHVLRAVQVLYQAATALQGLHHGQDALLGQQALQVQQGDAVVAAQHVHHTHALLLDVVDPAHQILKVFVLEGIQNQAGQEEVVGHAARLAQLFVGLLPVAGVDLGQDAQAVFLGNAAHPLQHLPGVRLVEEVLCAGGLGGVGEGIQTDDLCAVVRQLVQGLVVELPHQRRGHVQIHLAQIAAAALQMVHHRGLVGLEFAEVHGGGLFAPLQRRVHQVRNAAGRLILDAQALHQLAGVHLAVAHLLIEGVPVGHLAAVRHAHHQDGQAGLAEEHIPNQLGIRLDVALLGHLAVSFPELVPVDEEVLIAGVLAVFEQVLELGRQHRGVVQNQIELQIDAQFAQRVQVGLTGVALVQVVVDHREAPVQIGVEDAGQDVEGIEGALHLAPAQQGHDVGQGAAHAVRVGVQHHTGGKCGFVFHCSVPLSLLLRRSGVGHQGLVVGVAEQLAALGQNHSRLVGLRGQQALLDLQHHGGEGAVHLAVPVALAAVGHGLGGGAVQQHRQVHTGQVVVVAVGPLDDQHAGGGEVHSLGPQLAGAAAHPLQSDVLRARLELGDDAVHPVEVDLVGSAQVALQTTAARCLVNAQPAVLAAQSRVGVLVRLHQLVERFADFSGVQAGGHQTLQAEVPEHAQTLGVVVLGDAVGVVVAGQNIALRAQLAQVPAQQGCGLALAHAGAAAHADYAPLQGLILQGGDHLVHQNGQDGLCLGHVALGDQHLVAGHVAVGNLGGQGHGIQTLGQALAGSLQGVQQRVVHNKFSFALWNG